MHEVGRRADDDLPISLSEYEARVGKHIRTVERLIKQKRLPVWRDPILGTRVTSLGAIDRVRRLAAEKAEREFIQKSKLTR